MHCSHCINNHFDITNTFTSKLPPPENTFIMIFFAPSIAYSTNASSCVETLILRYIVHLLRIYDCENGVWQSCTNSGELILN